MGNAQRPIIVFQDHHVPIAKTHCAFKAHRLDRIVQLNGNALPVFEVAANEVYLKQSSLCAHQRQRQVCR